MEPELSLDEAKAVVAAKAFPRVTEELIKDHIKGVDYLNLDKLTVCIITMVHGFMVTGVSAPASDGNYDVAVGQRFAFENAFRQLWPLEGYLLRWRLHEAGQ